MKKIEGQLRGIVDRVDTLELLDDGAGGHYRCSVVHPATIAELSECVRACSENGAAMVPAGAMTWLDCGNPLRRADVIVGLSRMSGILDYSPADLTATVRAGTTLRELNQVAGAESQWLPLDPPRALESTIGGIAACASSGPLRLGFGSPRDYVLGLSLVHSDGRRTKCGGKVVKNVAGYDLNKLYVGSFGTLAILAEVTVKLRPLLELSETVCLVGETDNLLKASNAIIQSDLLPVSVFMIKNPPGTDGSGGRRLAVRFLESEAAVASQVESVMSLLDSSVEIERRLTGSEESRFWRAIADLDLYGLNCVRAHVPVSAASRTVTRLEDLVEDCVEAADVGAGIIRLSFDGDDRESLRLIHEIRRVVSDSGGTAFVERIPSGVRAEVDAWGDPGPALRLMRLLKDKFDPEGLLNPGKFVAGI